MKSLVLKMFKVKKLSILALIIIFPLWIKNYYENFDLGSMYIQLNFLFLILLEARKKFIENFLSLGCTRKMYFKSRIVYFSVVSILITIGCLIGIITTNGNIFKDNILTNISYVVLLYVYIYAMTTSTLLMEICHVSGGYAALNIVFFIGFNLYYSRIIGYVVNFNRPLISFIELIAIILFNLILSKFLVPSIEI